MYADTFLEFTWDTKVNRIIPTCPPAELPQEPESVYRALRYGTAKFLQQCGIKRMTVGLSGGIDSPVATWMMAKRGVEVEGVYFHSPPYTSEWAKEKVIDLAKRIADFTGEFRLYVVPFTELQLYLLDNTAHDRLTIHLKRAMMRAAEMIAHKDDALALVTGESVGQVASQTVKALQCTDAAQDLPILRPLIGMDKTEIIETSRHINTFETSILPYEDCCTIFTPPHPKIRPELEEILAAEAAMPGLAALEAEAAEQTERIRVRITDQVEFEG